jgi:hypothetical protein
LRAGDDGDDEPEGEERAHARILPQERNFLPIP